MLEPRELEQRRRRRVTRKPKVRRGRTTVVVLFLMAGLYVAGVSVMPLASLQTETLALTIPQKTAPTLPWPNYGQSAVGAVGFGLLAKNGDPKPLPIASVAKVITALAVLKQRPIHDDQPLPILTMTAEDVATFEKYVAQDQSVIKVELGEQLTQYQALQALLLPSANNMADALVRWAFGSTANYLEFVNPFTKTLGMTDTHIADASGFSPQTVSTATDLTRLAEIAMNHPVIAEIVSQPQADLPVAGIVRNVNRLVGYEGIVGIKTGNTDEAGGCYLFSAKRKIDAQHTVTLVGVVMGAVNLSRAIDDSLPIIEAASKEFSLTTLIQPSQIVGRIKQAGGAQTAIIATKALSQVTWSGQQTTVKDIQLSSVGADVIRGEEIGRIRLETGGRAYQVPVAAADTIAEHSYIWRLRHAAGYL